MSPKRVRSALFALSVPVAVLTTVTFGNFDQMSGSRSAASTATARQSLHQHHSIVPRRTKEYKTRLYKTRSVIQNYTLVIQPVAVNLLFPYTQTTTTQTSPEQRWLTQPEVGCIQFHESTNGKLSPNRFGIEPKTWAGLGLPGVAENASVKVQDDAAWSLYESRGYQPWVADAAVCGLSW